MAEAMDCEFVYAFVPKKELKALVRARAESKAKKILDRADTHMGLEDQKVNQSYEGRLQWLVNKLIESGEVW